MLDTIERHDDAATLEAAIEVCRRNNILCVEPRMSASDRAAEAVDQIHFELGVLEGAVRSGGMLSDQKRRKVDSVIRRLRAVGAAS